MPLKRTRDHVAVDGFRRYLSNTIWVLVELLALHVWCGIFVAVGVANSRWFLAENFLRHAAINTALGLLVNVGLTLWPTPRWGIVSAAAAAVAPQAVATYLSLPFTRRRRPSSWRITRPLTLVSSVDRPRGQRE